jgi:hypothetical protein
MEAQSRSRSTKSLPVAQKQKKNEYQKRQLSKHGHIALYGNYE